MQKAISSSETLQTASVLRGKLTSAALKSLVIVSLVMAWSVLVPIEGALIASGVVRVESNVRKVQAPFGGVIGQIDVREGVLIRESEVLVRLDDTTAKAGLGIIVSEMGGLEVRLARLSAERDDKADLVIPDGLAIRASADIQLSELLASERRFFLARHATRKGQKDLIAVRITQTRDEIRETDQQRQWIERQITNQKAELTRAEGLKDRGHETVRRVEAVEREILRSEERRAELLVKVAQANGRISDLEAQALQIDRELQTEVSKEIRETETELAKLKERRVAAEDQLRKLEIRAPVSGKVHNLTVFTTKTGYVAPGEVLMEIIPEQSRYIVEARLAPSDRDQVRLGQLTRVRFSGYNQSSTPEIVGTVVRVADEVTRDHPSAPTFYNVGIELPQDEIESLRRRLRGLTPAEDLRLVAGMPAETFIKTSERTFASYFIKPFMEHLGRVARGD